MCNNSCSNKNHSVRYIVLLLLAFLLTACSSGGDDDDPGSPPEITLNGSSSISLSVGETYSEPGATATDKEDGDITSSIIITGSVNTSVPGSYTLRYNVTDSDGASATEVTRTVNIEDTTAPVINLLGDNPLSMIVGTTYTELGATATDNVDGDISANIVIDPSAVNSGAVGTYTVTYNVSDAAGNVAIEVTRSVEVLANGSDVVAPEITLNGDNPLTIEAGETYSELGASASDNVDGDLTSGIVIDATAVNTGVPGSYDVTYTVSDAAGNTTVVTRTVDVEDTTSPIITLLGDNPLEVLVGATYTDPGATASDTLDGNISAEIVVGGDSVATGSVATFTVTYNVSDAAGNAATEVSRTVNVINVAPTIDSFSINPDPAYIDVNTPFSWSVSDANGDALTCMLDVDNDGTDDYTINNCDTTTSQSHIFSSTGDFTARLTVDDGIATPVFSTLDFSVIEPLVTSVSVNGPAVAGERLLYTITVANMTLQPIESVAVSLVVPTELTFHNTRDIEPNPTGCSTTCSPTQEANWSLGTLAAGESRTITVNALVDAATLNGVSITLPVTYSATGISNIQINKTVEVFNTPSADLALSASTDPVVANETFTYQIDVGNTSAGALTSTELRAFLPSGVTVNAISDGGAEVATGEVVWSVASLNSGASVYREITVVADGVAVGDTLTLTAIISHDGGLEIDHRSEFSVSVGETTGIASLLSVDIVATPQPVASSGILDYTVTVTNGYGLPVDDINVQLRVPAELTFHNTGDVEPDPTGCSTTCSPTQEANWNLGTLAAGASQIITINATVAAGLADGTMIVAPIRVTATSMEETINLQHTTVIEN